MTNLEIFSTSSAKEIAVMFIFLGFPLIFLVLLYVLIFREFPIPRISDIKETWRLFTTLPEPSQQEERYGGRNEDDYYYDIYGDDDAYARPRVRHPKNVDRAYNGGAERFHHGGGQDS